MGWVFKLMIFDGNPEKNDAEYIRLLESSRDEWQKIAQKAISKLKTLSKEKEPIEARLHLCESCAKEYPECDATIDGIEFGNGVGNDNIIGCTAYVNRWTFNPTEEQREAMKWNE